LKGKEFRARETEGREEGTTIFNPPLSPAGKYLCGRVDEGGVPSGKEEILTPPKAAKEGECLVKPTAKLRVTS